MPADEAWVRLSDFQRRVYEAVRRIPRGQTRSYQWVAQRIGRPRAARAVGNALRRNPFAPKVPCHRVVRSDGSLGGYAGGSSKKRELLRREGWCLNLTGPAAAPPHASSPARHERSPGRAPRRTIAVVGSGRMGASAPPARQLRSPGRARHPSNEGST